VTGHPDSAAEPCRRVAADELTPADPTPGMARRLGIETPGMWAGTVDTEPGAVSGWHHHGEHDTTLYIVSGEMRLESNPSDQPARAVIVRCGTGRPTVNVDGPAADGPEAVEPAESR
jgi:uncharacterized RmlC-like cupin family protein